MCATIHFLVSRAHGRLNHAADSASGIASQLLVHLDRLCMTGQTAIQLILAPTPLQARDSRPDRGGLSRGCRGDPARRCTT
jgi:hypothetical protein